ncbi:MAG: hypothetical protein ACK8QZ_08225, partial [Anaerolineales bacterium]
MSFEDMVTTVVRADEDACSSFVTQLSQLCIGTLANHPLLTADSRAMELLHRVSKVVMWFESCSSCGVVSGKEKEKRAQDRGNADPIGPKLDSACRKDDPAFTYAASVKLRPKTSHTQEGPATIAHSFPKPFGKVSILRSLIPREIRRDELLLDKLKGDVLLHSKIGDVKIVGLFCEVVARSRGDYRRLLKWAYATRSAGVFCTIKLPSTVASSGSALFRKLCELRILRNAASSRRDVKASFEVSVRSNGDKLRLLRWSASLGGVTAQNHSPILELAVSTSQAPIGTLDRELATSAVCGPTPSVLVNNQSPLSTEGGLAGTEVTFENNSAFVEPVVSGAVSPAVPVSLVASPVLVNSFPSGILDLAASEKAVDYDFSSAAGSTAEIDHLFSGTEAIADVLVDENESSVNLSQAGSEGSGPVLITGHVGSERS